MFRQSKQTVTCNLLSLLWLLHIINISTFQHFRRPARQHTLHSGATALLLLLEYLTTSQRNRGGEAVDERIKVVETDSPVGSGSASRELGSDGDGDISGQGAGKTEVYFVLQCYNEGARVYRQ